MFGKWLTILFASMGVCQYWQWQLVSCFAVNVKSQDIAYEHSLTILDRFDLLKLFKTAT